MLLYSKCECIDETRHFSFWDMHLKRQNKKSWWRFMYLGLYLPWNKVLIETIPKIFVWFRPLWNRRIFAHTKKVYYKTALQSKDSHNEYVFREQQCMKDVSMDTNTCVSTLLNCTSFTCLQEANDMNHCWH